MSSCYSSGRRSWVIVPVFVLFVEAFSAKPQYAWGAGTTGADFLQIPVGAAPAAMGSAYSALAANSYAPIWNPAGLGNLPSIEISGQQLNYLESFQYQFGSAVIPFGHGNGVGASIQYFGSGDINSRDSTGASLGTFSGYSAAYSLAYGRAVTEKWSLGLTGRLIEEKISDVSASALAADLGSIYQANESLTLAAVAANLGSKVKFLNESDPLPAEIRLGGSYKVTSRWVAALEGVFPKSNPAGAHMGLEWKALDFLALRAGYRTDVISNLSALAGFSSGIGVTLWGQELAFAWVPYGDLGNTEYVSLAIRFGEVQASHRVMHDSMHKSTQSPDPDEDSLPHLLDRSAP